MTTTTRGNRRWTPMNADGGDDGELLPQRHRGTEGSQRGEWIWRIGGADGCVLVESEMVILMVGGMG
jgi:hypothetical protein